MTEIACETYSAWMAATTALIVGATLICVVGIVLSSRIEKSRHKPGDSVPSWEVSIW